MKKTLLVSILLISCMLISTQIAFAGEPGPGITPDEHLVGPAIDAVLGLMPGLTELDGTDIVFRGECQHHPFSGFVPGYLGPIDLSMVTANNLIGWRVNLVSFPEIVIICDPKKGPRTEFIIVEVEKFNYYPDASLVIAEVKLMFVEPGPPPPKGK
jgi:hypothetical protein